MNCGTELGWFQHKSTNTRVCKFCAPYDPRLDKPKRPGPPKGTRPTGTVGRPLAPCGTPSAARRHRHRGETVDDKCRDAERAYKAAWRESKKEAKQ